MAPEQITIETGILLREVYSLYINCNQGCYANNYSLTPLPCANFTTFREYFCSFILTYNSTVTLILDT